MYGGCHLCPLYPLLFWWVYFLNFLHPQNEQKLKGVYLSCHIVLKLATLPEYSLFVVKSRSLIKKIGQLQRSRNKSNEWNGVLATFSISFTRNTRQVLPKLLSIIDFLSRNLNKISLCNISDSSAAKNIKRQIV